MKEDVFLFHEKKESCENLILFVHGFIGDSEATWKNKNGTSFADLLLSDGEIKNNFDIASYSYFTTLLNLFADTKEKFRKIKNLIRKNTHVKEKNLDIDELTQNLRTHFRFTLGKYKNIYVIAHSMGGLITKNLIAGDVKSKGNTKVKLFISLAVPHQGAALSIPGNIISSNLQILNLNPVEQFITALNQSWINLDEKPTTKYFYGSYDKVVTKHSAVAIDNIEKDVVSVAEDHGSISKPKDSSSVVYSSVKQFILEEHKNTELRAAGFQRLTEPDRYEEEIFVIKMIVADISEHSRENAKELFFNAEYMRKLLSSKYDKEQLQELITNIRQLYKDSYDKFLSDDSVNSGMLLAEVHSKITDEDSRLLKSFIPALRNYHKKGMLHQMANDDNFDIWWSELRKLEMKRDDNS